jgi:hypothetical protein
VRKLLIKVSTLFCTLLLAQVFSADRVFAVESGSTCPINTCAVCGPIGIASGSVRELLYPRKEHESDTPLQQKKAEKYFMSKNAGSCHIWKEGGHILGCMDGTSCAQDPSGYDWNVRCGTQAKSATDCQNRVSKTLTEFNCNAKVDCGPSASHNKGFPYDYKNFPYDCSVHSEYCMQAVDEDSLVSEHCPGGVTDRHSGPSTSPGIRSDVVVCKWRDSPQSPTPNSTSGSSPSGAAGGSN